MVTITTKMRLTMCALGISLVAATQPSNANQWTDMFKNMLIPPSANTTTTTTTSPSTDSITARETQLANRIVDAINNNKLSPSDTQNLKVQLDQLKALEANYRARGPLGTVETASINAELTKVENSFNQMLSTTPGASVPVSSGSRPGDDYRGGYPNNDFRSGGPGNNYPGSGYSGNGYNGGYSGSGYNGGFSGNGSWNKDGDRNDGRNFDIRQANVLKRIDERAANGRLTSAEAEDLRSDYRRLEQLEASYRADGNLSPYEIDVLQRGLDSIVRELKDKSDPIASQYPEIDRKQADLKKRIDDGVAKRLIKGGDAQRLNDNLNWIASIEAGFRQSGGRLDKNEADRILADLDRLSAKIDRVSINPLQDLVTRKTDLQKRINDSASSGKLSPRASRELLRDLDRVSYPLQSATTALPPDLVNRISADLDRINTQLNSSLSYSGSGIGGSNGNGVGNGYGGNNGGDWHGHGGPRDWGNH
ncbi:MAG: hypothetical protein U0103_19320 [Candidatus Obscuribacterales bacterium]|nr:hypothetical protein [Cyanobacteria bacterium SZAS LIN-5]